MHACTDVTGFGLLGHGYEMAHGSGVRLVFEAARLPAPARGARARGGRQRDRRLPAKPRLARRTRSAIAATVAPDLAEIAWDPQTSGGLLVAVPESEALALEAALTAVGVPGRTIGRVEARDDGPWVVLR